MKPSGAVIISLAALVLALGGMVYGAGHLGRQVETNASLSSANLQAISLLQISATDTRARLEMMERHYATMQTQQTAAIASLSQRIDSMLARTAP